MSAPVVCSKCGAALGSSSVPFKECFDIRACAERRADRSEHERDEARAFVKAFMESQERLAADLKAALAGAEQICRERNVLKSALWDIANGAVPRGVSHEVHARAALAESKR